MTKLVLQIFDVLKRHALLRWSSMVVLTIVLGLLLTRQSYKEDITDFLPLDHGQQKIFQDYQNTSSANRIFVIFQTSEGSSQPAHDLFCDVLDKVDTACVDYFTADDPEVIREATIAIYNRMPYLLIEEDYARIDSLLASPDYISLQLENDKQILMLPTAGMISIQVQHDPLNLFAPVLERMRPAENINRTMLLIDSPYGASETDNNSRLIETLQQVCDSVRSKYPEVDVHLTGGPVIAVENARQIKEDSWKAITLAVVVIMVLLWLAFRNLRNMLLIAFSIGWGWLFAMGCLTLVHNDVSIIVIGISSVILGIAVNYPLHLIAHLSHTTDIRSALREIVIPLVVGNITTVGAFLALVPLESVALRDLGLFSAFLLIGTILFVLLWLPHMVHQSIKTDHGIFERIGDVKFENKRGVAWIIVIITLILCYFSMQTSFDADLRNINYMTDDQKTEMQQLERLLPLSSQSLDLNLWNEWSNNNGAILCKELRERAVKAGFSVDSFDDFCNLITTAPKEDGTSLTSAIVKNLSDNFNYIGWACGFIVFFFLWFSLGSIELAILSFLPMALSWIWILGLMSLLGIQFNVVNVILATFIFGQGDDYTIFMTEGCQYEYTYRRKMLNSYKHSIMISALIMFIGIGALIIAKHPALLSLAHVTIVGMFTVVLMAWLVPPYIFRWLVYTKDGNERRRPITLRNLLCGYSNNTFHIVSDRYRYRGIEISTSVNRHLRYWRNHSSELELLSKDEIIKDNGWGETAMLIALLNPQRQYMTIFEDKERAIIARYAIEGVINNLKIE